MIISNHFLKSEIPVIPTELDEWLESNDLSKVLDLEKKKRKINLDKIVNSNLVATWPEWMILELKQGCLPNCVAYEGIIRF